MVLNGSINTRILAICRELDIEAIGISGVDAGPDSRAQAAAGRARDVRRIVDYGFVGDIDSVNTAVLEKLLDNGLMPVVSPLSADSQRHAAQHQRRHRGRRDRRRAVGREADAVHRRAGNSRARRRSELGDFLHGHQGPEAIARSGQPQGRHAAEGDRDRGGDPRRRAPRARDHLQVRDSLLAEIFTNEGTGTLWSRT
jgi:acetylglutamate kinase